MFILVLTTTAYAPLELLQGWLADIARINPLTQVVDAMRQGFIDEDVTWAQTWPASSRCRGCSRCSAPGPCGGWRERRTRHRAARQRNPGRAPCLDLRMASAPTTTFPSSPSAAARCSRRHTRRASAAVTPLLVYATEPEPVSMAVVLGFLLRGDRLAALRPLALARRAREPAQRDAPRWLHRPCRLLGPAAELQAARLLQRHLPPRRDDRNDPAPACSPGRGGWPSAIPPTSHGSPGTTSGFAPTAISRATACSGWSSRTSPASTPRRSSTPSGDGSSMAATASRCWSRATATSAGTRAGSATAAGRSSAR